MTYRGDNPCDVLLVGEGPGRSEDMLGGPFIGEAGSMLKTITDVCFQQHCEVLWDGATDEDFTPDLSPEEACDKKLYAPLTEASQAEALIRETHKRFPSLRIGYTNIVACLPLDEPEVADGSRKLRAPNKIEAEACRGRLLECIRIVRPKAIVTLGKEPTRFLPKSKDGLPDFVQFTEETIHPSALLRLQTDEPLRFIEARNRCLLTLTRVKRRLWGLEE